MSNISTVTGDQLIERYRDNDRMMLDMLDMLRQLPPDKQELILTQIYGMATMALLIEVNSPA